MTNMTTAEKQNVELVRRSVMEILDASEKNYDLIDELYSEDVVQQGAVSGEIKGRKELRAFMESLHIAFPDLTVTEEMSFCDDNHVAGRYTYTGTHEGEFQGIEATGKQVTINGNTLFRIEDGRISHVWPESDFLSLLQQVGVVPEKIA